MPTFKLWLGIAVVGSLIGIAYSNWNQSMQFGNIKVLILATYFMPILSSVMSMLILDVSRNSVSGLGRVCAWYSLLEIYRYQLKKLSQARGFFYLCRNSSTMGN